MQREIKFRAWDKKLKQYIITGFYILGETTGFNLIEQYYKDNNIEFEHGLEFLQYVELEQFTGLKDKKGVGIYEGDIFHLGDKTILYVVEWIDSGFKGRQINNKSTVGLEYWQDRIEIIGNIHDNPQLLNK